MCYIIVFRCNTLMFCVCYTICLCALYYLFVCVILLRCWCYTIVCVCYTFWEKYNVIFNSLACFCVYFLFDELYTCSSYYMKTLFQYVNNGSKCNWYVNPLESN